MKNRIIKVLVLALSLLMTICVAAACNDNSQPAHTHSYSNEYSFNKDSHWFECECGEDKGEELHSLVDGKCVCGYEEEPNTPTNPDNPSNPDNPTNPDNPSNPEDHVHSYVKLKYNQEKHWYECVCGAKAGEDVHAGGKATCSKKAACDECKQEYGELKEHQYTLKYDEYYHWEECEFCEKINEEEHYGGTATADEKAICEKCNQPYGGVNNIVTESKVLNVQIFKSGFGTDYIEAFKKQFEETFEDEGYKLNILAPDPFLMGNTVYRSVYSDSGIDIFFASSTSAEAGMAGEYGECFMDITDMVYKKPAIKFDGSEESQTIEEKLLATGGTVNNSIYNDKYYGLPYAFTNGGLNVNTRILYDTFGYTELPRTTKELFDMADYIMSKYDEEFIAPFTFSLSGNNYLNNAAIPWMAQLMGADAVYDYFGFMDGDKELRPVWKDGELVSGAYEVFGHEAFEDVFAALYQVVDWNTCTSNVALQGFEAAQAELMRGDGVFYFSGDWIYNEEKNRFKDKLGDIDFIRTPVISKVGLDLFGEGTSYGFDADKADKTLSTIIKYVDQNLALEEVESKAEAELGYSLETADVKTVCEKRGMFIGNGSAPLVHVSSKISDNQLPIVEAFLRFIASDDAGKMYSDNANTISPWNTDAMLDSDAEYLKSVALASHNQHNVEIFSETNRYKLKVGYSGIFAGMKEVWSVNFYEDYISKYDEETGALVAGNEVYKAQAKIKAKAMYDYAYTQVRNKLWQADGDYS